jgi:hypothetical protein
MTEHTFAWVVNGHADNQNAVGVDPEGSALLRRVNGWLTVFWIAMIPVSIALGWLTSVAYVSALSLWALVSGHWAAWQAARVEVNQERDAEAPSPSDAPMPAASPQIVGSVETAGHRDDRASVVTINH